MANKGKALLHQPLKLLKKPAAIIVSYAKKSNALSVDLEQDTVELRAPKRTPKTGNKANISIAENIIDGIIDLTTLDIRYYAQIEEAWLTDIKQLKAYYEWKNGHSQSEEDNYYSAVNRIRELLLSRPTKSLDRFDRIEHYLRKNYLRKNGSLADHKPSVETLIKRKAQHIYEIKKEANPSRNWSRAKLYARMFYENIIPAIVKKNEASTLAVLKAFQFSKSPKNRFLIINAFEAALAINFLNKKVVTKILNHPDLFDFSMEPVNDWPEPFVVPGSCKKQFRLHKEDKILVFDGAMNESQRNALVKKLDKQEHRQAIEELFEQSQLKLFSGTLL